VRNISYTIGKKSGTRKTRRYEMENAYEIKFEQAESIKDLVGKTLVTKDGRELNIARWEGQNLIVSDPATGKEGAYPAVFILDQIARGNFSTK
jgi:arabinogalactan endo-1,4-beta-galactosidase